MIAVFEVSKLLAILGALAGLLFVAVVLGVLITWRGKRLTLAQHVLLLTNMLFVRGLWRTTTSGPFPVPAGTGAIIVSNHCSSVEPLLLQRCTDRIVFWMVAREYVENGPTGVVFRTMGCIPVGRRGIDTAATKSAIRLAQQGNLVGMFPEGRINETGQILLPGRPGAAMVALKAGVPVVPCYVHGAPYNGKVLSPFFMRAHVRVSVGQPIQLDEYRGRENDRAAQEELTRRLLIEIAALGGVKDYQPALAGRNWHPDTVGKNAGDANGAGDNAEDADAEVNSEADATGRPDQSPAKPADG